MRAFKNTELYNTVALVEIKAFPKKPTFSPIQSSVPSN
jgi:hypothetical protein